MSPQQMSMFNPNEFPAPPATACPVEIPGLTERPTILLDLNFTLVANSPLKQQQRGMNYADKILEETYRDWLIPLFNTGYRVILWTVRFEKYRAITLNRINQLLHWLPDAAFFNPTDSFNAPEVKRVYLHKHIYPQCGQDTPYFALESNTQTRTMLREHGIPAIKLTAETRWLDLPGFDLPPFQRP